MKDIFPYIFGFLISLVMLAVAAYIAWKFRHRIREKLAAWLRTNNLENSALMDVLLVCDKLAGTVDKKIICKVFVVTQETGEQKISEETLSTDVLKNLYPDIYAQLEKQEHAQKSILKQVI